MITTTQWSPDTCGCVIEYEADTDRPEKDVNLKRYVKTCPIHSMKPMDDVLAENRMKNHAVNEVAKSEDKKPLDFRWSFDGNRILHIAGAAKKNMAQAAVDALLGTGKVIID